MIRGSSTDARSVGSGSPAWPTFPTLLFILLIQGCLTGHDRIEGSHSPVSHRLPNIEVQFDGGIVVPETSNFLAIVGKAGTLIGSNREFSDKGIEEYFIIAPSESDFQYYVVTLRIMKEEDITIADLMDAVNRIAIAFANHGKLGTSCKILIETPSFGGASLR